MCNGDSGGVRYLDRLSSDWCTCATDWLDMISLLDTQRGMVAIPFEISLTLLGMSPAGVEYSRFVADSWCVPENIEKEV